MKNYLKYFLLFVVCTITLNVSAKIKCDEGKPGDTVKCVFNSDEEVGGMIKNIDVSSGLTFVSCSVCNDTSYTIESGKNATFKFKISKDITESKTLKVAIAGEEGKIKVKVENESNDNSDSNESDVDTPTIYSVTLVPGNGKSNITKTCTVNSLNSTCDITLDNVENPNFNGWGKEKNCTEGATGNIKVNKNITYYACYKQENSDVSDGNNDLNNNNNNNTEIEGNKNLLLKSLIVKNGEDKIDLGFSIRKFEYSIVIPTTIEKLDVIALAQNESINVLIEGHDELKKAKNLITITLTDDAGTTNKYIINVEKTDKVAPPLLSSLVVGGYNIDFNPEKYEYKLKIDNGIKSLNVEPKVDNESYEVKILDNVNLKNGSRIKVVVSDIKNDQISTYIINIEKESNNLILYIAIAIIVLIVLVLLLLFVIKKGKKNNNNSNVNKKLDKKINVPGKVVNAIQNIPDINQAPIQNVVTPVVPTELNAAATETKQDNIETLDF